jgi:hypothetical protein
MIPAALRPFVPMMLQSLRQELANGSDQALASRLADAIRAECTPTERAKMAKVLQRTAEQLGV